MLIIGFIRCQHLIHSQHLAGTVQSLAVSQPQTVLLAIDGPRRGNPSDTRLCAASQRCVELINWPCEVKTRFHSQHLGIRYAITGAVSWAVQLCGSVIVLEDDAEPGSEAILFADTMLGQRASDNHVGHTGLYVVVPKLHQSAPHQSTRFLRHPESYAWATWHLA